MPREVVSFTDFTWRGVAAHVTIVRNYRVEGWTNLTVTLREPNGPPLPFLPDGRIIRHGVEQDSLDAAGGVVAYLNAWATRESHSHPYLNAVARWRQGDLFKSSNR